MSSTSNLLFIAPPAHEVGLALGFVGSFGVWVFLLVVGGFLGWSGGSSVMWGAVLHVAVLISDIHLVLELVDFLTNS